MTARLLRILAVVAMSVVISSCVVPPAGRSDRVSTPHVSAGWIRYAPGLFGDLYLPRAGGNRGVIVLLHGGAFLTGSRETIADYATPILDQLDRGFSVLSIDYRLTTATENRFPAAVTDVSAAIDWVRADGPSYGISTDTVLVAGHSSGATLAALIGLGANNPGSTRGTTSPIDGWIAISGIYDLSAGGVPGLERVGWLGPDATPEVIADASALNLVDAADPPGYIAHGANDPLAPSEQSTRLFGAIARAGGSPWFDLVRDPNCDGHIPTCAINLVYLEGWIDSVAGRPRG